jgi:hypothetical protein
MSLCCGVNRVLIWLTLVLHCFLFSVAIGQQPHASDEWLFDNDGDPNPTGCRGDVAHLAEWPAVRNMVAAYGIVQPPIAFQACAKTGFEVKIHLDAHETYSYTIYYPVPGKGELKNYIAPMAHELAHVYQLMQAGNKYKLLAQFPKESSSRHVELGADFLAGVVLKEFNSASMLNEFQLNLYLIGKYHEDQSTAHGEPQDRQNAFRLGYFLRDSKFTGPVSAANTYFQDELYGQFLNSKKKQLASARFGESSHLKLDTLDRCRDLRAVIAALRAGGSEYLQRCARPSGSLELAMLQMSRRRGSGDVCFIGGSGAPMLPNFQCAFAATSRDSSELTCFRTVFKDDVRKYAESRDKHTEEERKYLDRASSCFTKAGIDSGRAHPATYPFPVNLISDFQFGFVVTAGGEGSKAAVVSNGFASLDPDLFGADSDSHDVEYASFLITPNVGITTHSQSAVAAGDWSIEINDNIEECTRVTRERAPPGSPRIGKAMCRSIALRGPYVAQDKKEGELQQLQRAIVDSLRKNRYDEVPTSQLPLVNRDDINLQFRAALPYGQRNHINQTLASKYAVLVNQRSLDCTGDNGALLSAIFSVLPEDEVRSDRGTLFMTLAEGGDCADEDAETARFFDKTFRDAAEALNAAVGRFQR